MEKTQEKATQAYNKYCLGTKIEEMTYKNRERIRDEKIVKPHSCRTRDFSNANPMDREKFLKNFNEFLISWKKQNIL